MPNWCYTNITISCENEEKLKKFQENIDEWMNKDFVENDFHGGWLGNVVGNSGLCDDPARGEYFCRGDICNMSYYDSFKVLCIEEETAWSPCIRMWADLCERELGENCWNIIYSAEESGCELYWTNDPELDEKYVIDTSLDDFGFVDEYLYGEELLCAIKDYLEITDDITLDEAIQRMKSCADDADNGWFFANQWKYVDINEIS